MEEMQEMRRNGKKSLIEKVVRLHLSFLLENNFYEEREQSQGQEDADVDIERAESQEETEGEELFALCSALIINNFLEVEGLFRKSGNSGRIKALKDALLSTDPLPSDLMTHYSPHDLCSLIKKSFPFALFEPFLSNLFALSTSASSLPSSDEKRAKLFKLLLLLHPPVTVSDSLPSLLSLLHRISGQSSSNRMTSSSLATIFLPLLFPTLPYHKEQHLILCQQITFLIDNIVEMRSEPVPEDLLADIRSNLGKGEDEEISTLTTFCDRNNEEEEDLTARELASLYAFVQSQPKRAGDAKEDKEKRKWIEKFNKHKNGGLVAESLSPQKSKATTSLKTPLKMLSRLLTPKKRARLDLN